MILKAPVLAVVCALGATPAAATQPAPSAAPPSSAPAPSAAQPAPAQEGAFEHGRKTAEDIASQPARDVGVHKAKVPPALVKAVESPYGLEGLKTCRQISGAINDLNGAIGPDFQAGTKYHESHTAKIAEAGGKAVVNSLIPFRGLVREVSGAAPADRKYEAAVNMGYARRGFLRGIYLQRRCKPAY